MPAIARIGDKFGCQDHVAQGSDNVFANNIPVSRQNDTTTGHDCNVPSYILGPVSSNVFVNNIALAMLNSQNQLHNCSVVGVGHQAPIISASSNVFVNGS